MIMEKGTRLENKIAIVTGSTSGIGVGIATVFAMQGATVVICGRREEKGQGIVEAIQKAGGIAEFHKVDVTSADSIYQLIDDTVAKYGRLDILVNNAANVGLKDGSIDELTVEMWDAIMESDLRSVFIAAQHAVAQMRKQKFGSIVNIGSMASDSGDLGATAYASAKAGVNLLTQSIALQAGKDNIRCNCIRPGLIVTPDNDAKVPDLLKEIFLNNIEVNRYGSPADIAWLACFLASDESAYVTGQIMNVDGGSNTHAPTVAEFRKMNSRTW
ncbi:MAG: SDR family NAD(P)-dependent oxidoreductase [Oscillospiraceae bacterium]